MNNLTIKSLKKFLILFILITFLLFTKKILPQAGQLDSTFGLGGIVTTLIGLQASANSIAIQEDGKIIAAGQSDDGGDLTLVRYNPDGTLDNTFGTGGIVITEIENSNSAANSIVIQDDSKIIVAGISDTNGVIIRYNTDGTLDNSFGTSGILINTEVTSFSTVAIQDGKILAVGLSTSGSIKKLELVRLNLDGTLDNSFGVNGTVITTIGSLSMYSSSMIIQKDGKIVVAGSITNYDIILIRYNINGSLDQLFGVDGITITSSEIGGLFWNIMISSIAIQNSGKIILAGGYNEGGFASGVLVVYEADGTFSNISLNEFNLWGKFISVKVQSDDKIVVAGLTGNIWEDRFLIARFNSDISLDTTFAGGGVVSTKIGDDISDVAHSIALQNDGKIIVAGKSLGKGFALVRYLNDQFIPVELISFNATLRNTNVILNWETATEINNYGFEIERMVDNQQLGHQSNPEFSTWDKIGFVQGSGNGTSTKSYSYIDKNPTGGSTFEYRLKQLDFDGKFEYSNIVEVLIIPSEYKLFQNYPNPFNPTTTIRYSVPEEGLISIKVYDITGREVMTLINEVKQPGNYDTLFDGSEFSSGVYFYRMITRDFSATKQFMILK